MELNELIATIQKIDLMTTSKTHHKIAGSTTSLFKGRGVVFDSIRKYERGDDVRNINWNVTARFNDTFINTFSEDKVRTIWILIDCSGSVSFGTKRRTKLDLEIEIAATLAYSAIRHNDAVGVVFFSDAVNKVVMPLRGMTGFWHIAKALVDCRPLAGNTKMDSSLEFLLKENCSHSLVFLLSDFKTIGYQESARILALHNDFFTIQVQDVLETTFPKLGWIQLKDIESDVQKWVNTASANFQKSYEQQQLEYQNYYNHFLLKYGVSNVTIQTHDEVVEKLALLL
jgi:uncharacterized protein (DUF58 family)